MTNNLEQKLLEMENKNSYFEKEVRKLDFEATKVFLKNNQIVPTNFKETSNYLQSPDKKQIAEILPRLSQEITVGVLEADGTEIQTKGKRVAILFSGGPAPGGHNVIIGVKKALGAKNILFGIKAGPKGLLEGDLFEISDEKLAGVQNMGGFDFLGSDRTKIKSPEQFAAVRATIQQYKLDGLIVVGGDDSNTNAAFLAEYLMADNCKVIGVPKTIDGDLQVGKLLPISFGFDTATKIYSELVGNILQDTPSSRKYWHFIKLMGRFASHVALEVALQTKPAITLISEEVEIKKINLNVIIEDIAKVVAYRAGKGINHGVVLVPEGLIEFIPDFKEMLSELNEVVAEFKTDLEEKVSIEAKKDFIYEKLKPEAARIMAILPDAIENMLLLDRDAHGNLQVSQIPTELLLIEMTANKLKEMQIHADKFFGKDKIDLTDAEMEKFKKFKFQTNNHFFGYEGRCGAPSRFDATYTFNLGLSAGSLILAGKTGYMVAITDLDKGGKALAIPLVSLLNLERRHGKDELVIKKALVETTDSAFKFFVSRREAWAKSDLFASPGPRQFWGPTAKQVPFTVALNQGYGDVKYR